jgi:hypothetical protein
MGGRTSCVAVLVVVGLVGCGDDDDRKKAEIDYSIPVGCKMDEQQGESTVGSRPNNNPEAECTRYWTNGPIAKMKEAPPLTTCVGNNGTPLVYRGGDAVCEELDLPYPSN